ncbi:hypothetical protein [Rahnella sp. PCH160]|uniref:hypothetical protein n=1 Tax=Rahnella sp. PCH160 TaxID=3447928 RepID=UPI0039FC65AE
MSAINFRVPALAFSLGTVFVLSLTMTLLGVAHQGLDTPLTHGFAGAAAIFFTLFMVSERYNPQPLLPQTLRVCTELQISLWASVFFAALGVPAFFLLGWLLKNSYGFGPLQILLSFALILLMVRAGHVLGEKIFTEISTDKHFLLGFTLVAAATGIIAVMPEGCAFWLAPLPAMIISGLGLGMVNHARNVRLQAIAAHGRWLNGVALIASTVVSLALLTMIVTPYPGYAGLENGFTLLGIFALAGMVVALMAEE